MSEKFVKPVAGRGGDNLRDQANNGQGRRNRFKRNGRGGETKDGFQILYYDPRAGIKPVIIDQCLEAVRKRCMGVCEIHTMHQIFLRKPEGEEPAEQPPAAAAAAGAAPTPATRASRAQGSSSSSSSSASAGASAGGAPRIPAHLIYPPVIDSKIIEGEYPVLHYPGEITAEELETFKGKLWEQRYKEYSKAYTSLAADKTKIAGFLLEMLDFGCEQRIRQTPDGEAALRGDDPLLLIRCMRTVLTLGSAEISKESDPSKLFIQGSRAFLNITMNENEPIEKFYEKFKAEVERLRLIYAKAGKPFLSNSDLAMSFVEALNSRYNEYRFYLDIKFMEAPKTYAEAYDTAVSHSWSNYRGANRGNKLVMAAAASYNNSDSDQPAHFKYPCSKCGKRGHRYRDCPEKNKGGRGSGRGGGRGGGGRGRGGGRGSAEEDADIDKAISDERKQKGN